MAQPLYSFSNLSLILHLIVIGVVKLIHLVIRPIQSLARLARKN